MTDELVARLLRVPPFCDMDPAAFPRSTPLHSLLKNDARFRQVQPGEILIRQGDYGASAFLLLDGLLRVSLEKLDPALIGQAGNKQPEGWRGVVARLLGGSRPLPSQDDSATRGLFLHDFPTALASTRTATIEPGELFGELSAMTRSPRTATVVAERASTLVEIRWQGLRDLMRYSPELRRRIDQLYRERGLLIHLRETQLFSRLSEAALQQVAESITLESYGEFDWRDDPLAEGPVDPYRRGLLEPVVFEKGQPVESILLVRNGFARVWRPEGEGRLTLSYAGKGAVFGAEEAAACALRKETPTWRRSMSAVGFLDALRLPVEVFRDVVLPTLPPGQVTEWAREDAMDPGDSAPGAERARRLDFLVDRRLTNGQEAMVIDLERCTRCDDCVRSCAATHEGEPRFVRQGATLGSLQFTQACMHCVDPVCMIGCPTGAIHRDEATGVVGVNDATCIGCSVCADSCPYNNIQMVERRDEQGAIVFDQQTGQPVLRASKCDLCNDRATGPACQDACPHDALVRIDLSEPLPLIEWSQR